MSDEAAVAESRPLTLASALDDIRVLVRRRYWWSGFRSAVDTDQFDVLLPRWQAEIATVRRIGPNQAVPSPLQVEHLVDPSHIETLIVPRSPGASGVEYLIPVVAAWGILGYAQHGYGEYLDSLTAEQQLDQDTARGFFSWWSGETLGPSMYSFAVAGLLGLIVVLLFARSFRVRGLDSLQRNVQRHAAEVAVLASDLLLRSPAAIEDTAAANTSAAHELREAAEALTSVVNDLRVKTSDVQKNAAAVDAANEALASLATACDSLAAQATSLEMITGQLAPVLSGWEDQVRPVSAAISRLSDQVQSLHDSATTLQTATSIAAGTVPAVKEVLDGVEGVSNQIVSAQPFLTASASSLEAATTSIGTTGTDMANAVVELKNLVAEISQIATMLDSLEPIPDLTGFRGE